MKALEVIIAEPQHEALLSHLFPSDGDEHGAVLLCGYSETKRRKRLLVREVRLARDGIDYVPGKRGYRQLEASFIANAIDHASENGLVYLAVHNHGSGDHVAFSKIDTDSHRRSYPSLLEINNGRAVGALVFATKACAGRIWNRHGVEEVCSYRIIGSQQQLLHPSPETSNESPFDAALYDRQTRMLGSSGQQILSQLKIGIIGTGGIGSILVDQLAHKGIRSLVLVDPDRLELSNLPRWLGYTRTDRTRCILAKHLPLIAPFKVNAACRSAKRTNPSCEIIPIRSCAGSEDSTEHLLDCDFVFLAADTQRARLFFNILSQQFMIPGIQLGVKIATLNGKVGSMTGRCRTVFPGAGAGCLECNGLIDRTKLTEELMNPESRLQRQYVKDEPAAAIMEFNSIVAAQGIATMTGHFCGTTKLRAPYLITDLETMESSPMSCMTRSDCPHCATSDPRQVYAKGQFCKLPNSI